MDVLGIYMTFQKFGVCKIIKSFWKVFSHQCWVYSANSNDVKWLPSIIILIEM